MEARPNRNLDPAFEVMPARDFGLAFERTLRRDAGIDLAYGRMNVSIDGFLTEALLITYKPAAAQSAIPAATGSGFVSRRSRDLFRQQVGSDRWKEAALADRDRRQPHRQRRDDHTQQPVERAGGHA